MAYAWYGEGTRFLDISDPTELRQFAYWRPDDGIVWASYMHGGYVYTADRTRGVDILRLTKGARQARVARREVQRGVAVAQAAAVPGERSQAVPGGPRHGRALPAGRLGRAAEGGAPGDRRAAPSRPHRARARAA